MSAIKRGALIVIEGVDRSGKSTQCKNLVKSLNERNIKAQLMSFPDRTTPIGQIISEYLKNKSYKLNDQAIHLLFAANRWENSDKMRDLLKSGVTLIVDRYSYSGVAFTSIKKNIDLNWCKQPEIGLPKPDLVFLLNLNTTELQKRPGFGGERYENAIIQQKVADIFMEFSKTEDNWKVIDASQSVTEVEKTLLEQILGTIEGIKATTPLENLDFK